MTLPRVISINSGRQCIFWIRNSLKISSVCYTYRVFEKLPMAPSYASARLGSLSKPIKYTIY